MQLIERLAHLVQPVRLSAQPSEDAALPARAIALEEPGDLARVEAPRARMRRRGRREVGEEELDLRAVVAAFELDQLAIRRVEAHGGIGLPVRHVVDILLELDHRPVDDRRAGGIGTGEAFYERFAKAR